MIIEQRIEKERVIDAIKTVFYPEIPVNVYDLCLIYGIEINHDNQIFINMTLTSPACPVAQSLPNQVKQAVMNATGIESVVVDIVWEPPWTKDTMNDDARFALNLI